MGEIKSVQNSYLWQNNASAQNQQNADVKNDELVADLKRHHKKQKKFKKLASANWPITKIITNEQNKNQLLLSKISMKNPRNFGNDFFRKGIGAYS